MTTVKQLSKAKGLEDDAHTAIGDDVNKIRLD